MGRHQGTGARKEDWTSPAEGALIERPYSGWPGHSNRLRESHCGWSRESKWDSPREIRTEETILTDAWVGKGDRFNWLCFQRDSVMQGHSSKGTTSKTRVVKSSVIRFQSHPTLNLCLVQINSEQSVCWTQWESWKCVKGIENRHLKRREDSRNLPE